MRYSDFSYNKKLQADREIDIFIETLASKSNKEYSKKKKHRWNAEVIDF